jgi:type IV pilus assembly protein PilO
MAGAMQDFARLSTGKKVAIFVGIGVLGLLIYMRFVLNPLNDDVESAKNTFKAAAAKATTQEQALPRYNALWDTIKRDRPENERNRKMLPNEAETFFETVQNKAKASGAEILKYSRKPEEAVDNFVRVPLDVELSGSFMQLKRFFASLVQDEPASNSSEASTQKAEAAERIVSIENLVITQPPSTKAQPVPPLTAKFVAVTYRQDERASAAGSGSNAAPIRPAGVAPMPTQGSAGAAAPLPSPASVKPRVDDAMKKSEDHAGENKDLLKKGN